MRIGKMSDVRYDAKKRRYYVEKRVPKDVCAILGLEYPKAKRRHKFAQSVDRETAYDQAVDLIRDWKAEWNGVRPRPLVMVQHPRRLSLPMMTPELSAQIRDVLAREFPQLLFSERGGFGLAHVEQPADGSAPLWPGHTLPPVAASPMKLARKVFPYPEIIPVWEAFRLANKEVATSDDDRADAIRKLERLFKFLGHDDMNKVTGSDLDRYVRDDLRAVGSRVKQAGGYRDHAIMLRSLFARAFEKQLIDQNPTLGRLAYKRGAGKRRDDLTPEQYRMVMLAARQCADPVDPDSRARHGAVRLAASRIDRSGDGGFPVAGRRASVRHQDG